MSFIRTAAILIVSALAASSTAIAQDNAMTARERLAIHIEHLWLRDSFVELEALAEGYRRERVRAETGKHMISVFYQSIYVLTWGQSIDRASPSNIWPKLEMWKEQFPDSPTPYVAKAVALWNEAIAFDFNLALQTAGLPKRPLNSDRLSKVLEYLDSTKGVASTDPHWHYLKLSVLNDLKAPDKVFFSAYNEAMQKFPLNEGIYFSAARFLKRTKPDAAQAIDDLAKSNYDNTRNVVGSESYAITYHYADLTPDKMQNGPIDWPRFIEGFSAYASRYRSEYNDNSMAYYACISGRMNLLRTSFTKLLGAPNRLVWKSEPLYESCRRAALE